MTPLVGLTEPTLFGMAAAASSVAGIVLAILSHRQGRKSAERDAATKTHDQLLEARAESERLSEELHQLRMERRR